MASKLEQIAAQLENTDYGIPDYDVEWLIARVRKLERGYDDVLAHVPDWAITIHVIIQRALKED